MPVGVAMPGVGVRGGVDVPSGLGGGMVAGGASPAPFSIRGTSRVNGPEACSAPRTAGASRSPIKTNTSNINTKEPNIRLRNDNTIIPPTAALNQDRRYGAVLCEGEAMGKRGSAG